MQRFIIVAATSMAVGAMAFVGCKKETATDTTPTNTNANTNTDTRTAGDKTRDSVASAGQKTGDALGTAVDKTGDAAKAAADKLRATTQPSADAAMKNTRDALAAVAEACVTKGGLNDVVARFTKSDRDRLGTFDKASFTDLDAEIDNFRKDWKAKYNQDFKLTDKEQVVFAAPVDIKVGDMGDAARLGSEKTGPGTPSAADQKAVNNATNVTFPAGGGAPAVTLHLMNEGTLMNSYKIDVPDTLNGTALKQNLIAHINMADKAKDTWPTDVNEAYRIVSQHLFAAITDAK